MYDVWMAEYEDVQSTSLKFSISSYEIGFSIAESTRVAACSLYLATICQFSDVTAGSRSLI
jgi:hypothetical protein